MNTKSALSSALLLFVLISVAILLGRELRGDKTPPADVAAMALPPDGLVAYYFHGDVRCPTCRNIENYAHEAVESGFGPQLASGAFQWRVVNYESPANAHFAQEYELFSPTVVLVRTADGKPVEWRNLSRVWELVGNKDEFVAYVRQQVDEMQASSSARTSAASASPITLVRGQNVGGDRMEAETISHQVAAIYFHRTQRCPTCKRIGALAEEAVLKGFPQEVKSRLVTFRLIDFQDPRHAALAKQYSVDAPRLVLTNVFDGETIRWSDLPRVWQLAGKPEDLRKYVQDAVRVYLLQTREEAASPNPRKESP